MQNEDGETYDDVLNKLEYKTAHHLDVIRARCCIQVQMAMYVLGTAQNLSIHRQQMWLPDNDGAQKHITDKYTNGQNEQPHSKLIKLRT